MTFDLEIVQPLYNPGDDWVEIYMVRYQELKELFTGINLRIILVNDGSLKNFDQQIINSLQNKIQNLKIVSYDNNRGKGYAVRQGIKQTEADFGLYTDYDFPYEAKCLFNAYKQLKAGNDIVVGIRNKEYYNQLGFKRKIVSKTCNFLNKMFLKIPNADTQSGLKGFSIKVKELMLKTTINEFLFDTEFVCRAYQAKNTKIATVEIELRKEVMFTGMSLKTIFNETKNFISIVKNLYLGKLKE